MPTRATTPWDRRRRADSAEECSCFDDDGSDPHRPYHDASPRCQSGQRNHCTCDTCY